MLTRSTVFFLFILMLSFVAPQHLYSQGSVAGSWYGELDIQGTKLILTADITIGEQGQLSGFLHSPMQGANDIPIGRIDQRGDSVFIGVPALMASIRGKLLPGDTVLECRFEQGPFVLPLTLVRTDAPFQLRRPQEPQRPFPYLEEEVSISHHTPMGEVVLAGTLTLPDNVSVFPAVVLVSGSGPQDRNEEIMGHKPFLVISDYLTRRGVAVLRYDDRGTAASTGEFHTSTTLDFADDALAAVRFLQGHPNIHPDAIGIVGHSEGGLIAQIIATRPDNPAAFIVMLAGPTVTGEEILLSQIEAILAAGKTPKKTIKRNLEDAREIYLLLKSAESSEQAADLMRGFYAERRAKTRKRHHESYGYTEEATERMIPVYTSPWFITFLKSDPSRYLSGIEIPMLALFGGKDLQVLADLNIRALHEVISRHNKTQFTIRNYPGRNHLFQEAATGSINEYATLEETFGEEVMEDILRYILEVTGF